MLIRGDNGMFVDRPSARVRAMVVFVGALLLAAGMVGCASDSQPAAEPPPVTTDGASTQVPETTATAAPGLETVLGQEPGSDIALRDLETAMASAMPFLSEVRFEMSATLEAGTDIEAEGQLKGRPASRRLTQTEVEAGKTTETEVIVLKEAVYLRSPEHDANGRWVMVTGPEATDAAKAFSAPIAMIDSFRGAAQSASYLGTDPVAGVEAHGLSLSSGAPGDSVVFWLASDGRPLRVDADVNGIGQMTVAFSRHGEPVTIQAPPAEQIFENSR